MIKTRQLIYLKKAIEVGNITKAAEQLHVAQTALGIQIRNLEDELGVQLLHRHSRGVTATAAGELMLAHAESILSKLDEARVAVTALSGSGVRPLSLGLTPSIIRLVGDDVVMRLEEQFPQLSLRIVEDFSFVLQRLLTQGELDCALTYTPDPDPNLERRAILEEDLVYITAPEFGLPEGPISFREMIESDLALTGQEDAVYQMVNRNAERLGLKLNVAYQVQSIRAVKNLVAKGVAATVMPYGAAEGELRKGRLLSRKIEAPAVTRTLVFTYPRDRAAIADTPDVARLIALIGDLLLAAEGPIMRRL
ncbi:hypothetical protein BV394_06960 [Brevirhabdus pacifica]|uniref:Uncharacterized protein n=1 Tax=Brevirhabdus pacifica TaxID=1267768 RepID=A0A1U7DHY9_9RHOB|nr:LysR family transcriptional regulator [Brevirhabdus pacifica]APX89488.1 hypothetical protein BV394_06960 [Brevirhabdus pacifica]OWU76505.1 hypothetical protein ATO5_09340 [Loktanella sp. 22II-4b]PJJ85863.1 LysR family transcriptional regulator [Brevirhabdus pacifica]